MTNDSRERAETATRGGGLVGRAAPEAMNGFGAPGAAATAAGALDTKTKGLMALAIGIATHCDGCVAYHTRTALKHGATRQEVAETVAVGLYMGGGPAAVYGADALRAFDQMVGAAGG
jgi:AhpD family alkylhydroperoxidase